VESWHENLNVFAAGYFEENSAERFKAAHCQSSSVDRIGDLVTVFMVLLGDGGC
jgi:hypothetical protein